MDLNRRNLLAVAGTTVGGALLGTGSGTTSAAGALNRGPSRNGSCCHCRRQRG